MTFPTSIKVHPVYFAAILAMLTLFASVVQNPAVMVIGHRGAMGHETENSLASIQKAIDLGVDMIEIDVFQIKSQELVVFHDQKVDRLTQSTGNIEDFNKKQLDELRLENGQGIPQLEDALRLINRQVKLNVELKGANTAPQVARVLNKYIDNHEWQPDDFLISSFHWDALAEFRKLDGRIPIGVLAKDDPLEALEIGKALQAVAIHPRFKSLNQENVTAIQRAGFKIYTWTVNEPEDIKRIKSLGVDGIITDFPDRVGK